MPNKIKILFVDDDRYFARLYKEALEKDFDVIVSHDAETATRSIKSETDVVAAVVDVMMPPPAGYKYECHDGNTTGLWIVSQCCEEIKSKNIAILLFSHLGVQFIKDELRDLNLALETIEIHSKTMILAEQLPLLVAKLIGRRGKGASPA